ncbi:hypothetical protein Cfor_01472, partial [Coptotermes formosanus]
MLQSVPDVFTPCVNRQYLRQDAGGRSGSWPRLGVRWWRSHQARRGAEEDPGVRLLAGEFRHRQYTTDLQCLRQRGLGIDEVRK